ncbi:unnamed protein product [Haemonchus placei]|uniref:Type II toxin-antitoxin system ParD family antitoxin n=1 Tax=Haemonchus placei TaxID=6290 RepID=A0A0N4WTR2_HAEPC|nr:unnamed protein product [Haemonchus placei]
MIRGEHRDIQEEIANRILSDISEEGSVSGSLGSVDDLEALFAASKKVGALQSSLNAKERNEVLDDVAHFP